MYFQQSEHNPPHIHAIYGEYGISWNDEIDLSCDELWENGYI